MVIPVNGVGRAIVFPGKILVVVEWTRIAALMLSEIPRSKFRPLEPPPHQSG